MKRWSLYPALFALALASANHASFAQDAAPPAANAEDQSGGMLVNMLENLLSNENQSIEVIGLEGALSARARLEELRVLDRDGAWLILRGAVLDWNRLALVRGRFSVNELTAEEIIVERAPLPTDEPDLPDPEAASEPFALPELPVSVLIDQFSIRSIKLGEALIGQSAELDLNGALTLADGTLAAQVNSDRLDRPGDAVALDVQAANDTRDISINLDFDEASGGLVGSLLQLPGSPDLTLNITGDGTYDDLVTDILLATDGTARLEGTVELATGGADSPGTQFTADVGGDVRALLDDVFDPFFGEDTRLSLAGRAGPEANIVVDDLSLDARALVLDGTISLAGGRIETLSLDGSIAYEDGAPVVLPIPGGQHQVGEISLTARAIGAKDRWSLGAQITELQEPDFSISSARLISGGTLIQGDTFEVLGDIRIDAEGLEFDDPSLAQATGPVLRVAGRVDWNSGDDFELRDATIEGAGYFAALDGSLQGLNGNGQLDATARIEAGNLAQFGGLAGVDLSGVLRGDATVSAQLLTGSFDAQANLRAVDLATGIAEVDPLLTGETTIVADAGRGTDGITLRDLTLSGTALSLTANGQLQSDTARLDLTAGLDDLGRIVPELPGPVTLTADVIRENSEPWSANVALSGPKGASGEITAQLDGDQAQADLDLEAIDLGALVPAELLPLGVTGTAKINGGDLSAHLDLSSGVAITASVDGAMTNGEASGQIMARIDGYSDLPEAIFPVTVDGSGTFEGGALDAQVDVAAADAAQMDLDASMSAEGMIDIVLNGDAQAIEKLLPAEIAPVSLSATAKRAADGIWAVAADLAAAEVARLDIDGQYTEGGAGDADLALRVAPVEGLIPDGIAPIMLDGRATLSEAQEVLADLVLKASNGGVDLNVTAQHDGVESAKLKIDGDVTALGSLLPQQVLPVNLNVEAGLVGMQANATAAITAGTAGELNAKGTRNADGVANADLSGQIRATGIAQVDGFLPLDLTGSAQQAADGMVSSELRLTGQSATFIETKADMDPTSGKITVAFDALLDELQRIVPQLPGQLTANGQASSDGSVWTVAMDMVGPSNISATANGTYDTAAGTADVATQGNLALRGANPFLRPNELSGSVGFDLALSGAPSLENISGSVTTRDSALDLPGLGQRIVPINVTVNMDQGSANLNVSAGLEAGGGVTVTGPVGLTAPYPANLNIALNQLVITDNLSIESGASGNLRFNGDILGRSLLAGTIQVAPTFVNIANLGGSVSAAPIPEITHVGESAASYLTREHAGLVATDSGEPPDIALDLTILATDGIKVSGMGLDAKLAGTIQVDGSLAEIRPSGSIGLESGTFVILGRPLRLTDGRVSLQDSLKPYIRFAASSVNSEGSATIAVEGPLDQPEVKISSVPERPPEEALALLLFGNRQSQISPIKIAQIAAQFAATGGSLFGGEVEEDTARSKILNPVDHLYTDFAVNNDGQNEVIINLDLTDNVTLRGTVDNAGDTALGVFFQRDY